MHSSATSGGPARVVAPTVVLVTAAAAAALAAAASVGGPVAFGEPRWSVLRGGDTPPPATAATPRAAQDGGAERVLTLPGWVLPVLAVAAVALAAALVYRLVRPGDPRWPAGTGRARDRPAAAPPASRLAAGRRAEREATVLRRAGARGDPRDDVVRAWCSLEDVAAAAGLPRAACATPTEFTTEVLGRLGVDEGAVADLLRLYHRARFSTAAMPPGSGPRALAAVEVVAAGLRTADPPGDGSPAQPVRADPADGRKRRGG